jgi:hypothetical protein
VSKGSKSINNSEKSYTFSIFGKFLLFVVASLYTFIQQGKIEQPLNKELVDLLRRAKTL